MQNSPHGPGIWWKTTPPPSPWVWYEGDVLNDGPLSLKTACAPSSLLKWGKGAPTPLFFRFGISLSPAHRLRPPPPTFQTAHTPARRFCSLASHFDVSAFVGKAWLAYSPLCVHADPGPIPLFPSIWTCTSMTGFWGLSPSSQDRPPLWGPTGEDSVVFRSAWVG